MKTINPKSGRSNILFKNFTVLPFYLNTHYYFKTAVVLLTMVFAYQVTKAQDTIVKVDNTIIVATVLEVNKSDVLYNKYEEGNGSVYKIPKSNVYRIIYKKNQVWENPLLIPKPERIPSNPLYGKNSENKYGNHQAYFGITDLIFKQITFGYQFNLNNGRIAISIPFSVGMANLGLTSFDSTNLENYEGASLLFEEHTLPYDNNNLFRTAIELKVYGKGRSNIRYFIGPTIQYGQYRYFFQLYDITSPNYYRTEEAKGEYFGVMVNNGIDININSHFDATIYLSVEFDRAEPLKKYTGLSLNEEEYNFVGIQAGVRLGYRF